VWKKISSKTIFEHPRVNIIEDLVELPNGKRVEYIKYNTHGDAATLICRSNENEVLLQKQYSYPPNKVLLQFPGGLVPKDEDIKHGANRELMEETGLKANKLTLLGSYYTNNRRSDSKMYVFLCEDFVAERKEMDIEEEDIENYWIKVKDFEELLLNNKIENVHALASWAFFKIFINKTSSQV
jgi:ADP-ribose pyrophosphatase